jgi:RNA polymerase sigma-70 factor (sigma-E family)
VQAEFEGEYVEYVTARLARLRRLAYLLCGDEHRADDLVQVTITKLYERWRRVRMVDSLDQYVRAMLVRAFLDEKRRAWSSRVWLTGQPPERPAPDGPDVEQRAVLRQALTTVPRRQRAVLVLRFLCDLPVNEVARLLGCSAGNVKSQTHHGLAALRRRLGEPGLASLGQGGQ